MENQKSSCLYTQKSSVEAFLFDGTLLKDGDWVVPEWVVESILSGIISYKEPNEVEDDEFVSVPENLKVSFIYLKYSDIEEPIKIDLSENPVFLVSSLNRIYVYREDEFKNIYSPVEEVKDLVRVDILPEVPYNYKPMPVITGEWIYVPPCSSSRKEFYAIRCSNCGAGHKVKNIPENHFSSVIAPWHFCFNCGAEMQNSNLPKRRENDVR